MADATPRIVKAAQRFKRALLAQNDRALADMARAYTETWKRLKPQLDQVTRLIREAEIAGKKPVVRVPGVGAALGKQEYSINWLARQARYQELMYQAEVEVMRYSRQAAVIVGRQQEAGLNAGRDHALGLMETSLGPPPAEASYLRWTWNRIPEGALQNLVGFLADGSPLESKFAQLAPATAQAIKDTFAAGLAEGWNPRKIARTIQREYHGALANTLVTCRTEVMRAYRTAAQETYRANEDVVSGWIWSCARQKRTCAACWGQDGTFHPLTESLVEHPAGRCVACPQTKTWAEITGRPTIAGEPRVKPWDPEEHFRKLSEADQKHVLGPGRYQLWKDGKITLRDIPVRERSKIWGDHFRPKTLKELAAAKLPKPGVGGLAGPALAERAKALKIPPGWNNVWVSSDANAHLQATGVDAKGRKQYRYSAEFREGRAAAKFERVKALDKAIPKLDAALKPDVAMGDETARAVYTVRHTGFRPGSEVDTKAKVKAYGVSTLEARHVIVKGDRIGFDFIGKKGVHITRTMENKELAAVLSEQLAGRGPDQKLFATSGAKMNRYLRKATGEPFKIKDLRTWTATSEALREVKTLPIPATERELVRSRLAVAKNVAGQLGNTPAMCLQAYIMPEVWGPWQARVAMAATR